MAHGDYNCCAVCDCKLEYSNNAQTKSRICESCLIKLRDHKLNIITVEEFAAWVEKTDKAEVKRILESIGYSQCFYTNSLDELIKKKIRDDLKLERINDNILLFTNKYMKAPNRIRMHKSTIRRLADEMLTQLPETREKVMNGGIVTILGLKIVEDNTLDEENCIVYFEEDKKKLADLAIKFDEIKATEVSEETFHELANLIEEIKMGYKK